MLTFLVTAFLVAHGLVHGIMFALPYDEKAKEDLPFNPAHSWLIGDAQSLGLGFGLLVAFVFLVAALAHTLHTSWQEEAAILAAALSLVLLVLFFSIWWTAGLAISITIAAAAWRAQTGSP